MFVFVCLMFVFVFVFVLVFEVIKESNIERLNYPPLIRHVTRKLGQLTDKLVEGPNPYGFKTPGTGSGGNKPHGRFSSDPVNHKDNL